MGKDGLYLGEGGEDLFCVQGWVPEVCKPFG